MQLSGSRYLKIDSDWKFNIGKIPNGEFSGGYSVTLKQKCHILADLAFDLLKLAYGMVFYQSMFITGKNSHW